VAIRPFAWEKKRFAQKFTDGQTDDGRLAIVLAHSWNELKIASATVLEVVVIVIALGEVVLVMFEYQ